MVCQPPSRLFLQMKMTMVLCHWVLGCVLNCVLHSVHSNAVSSLCGAVLPTQGVAEAFLQLPDGKFSFFNRLFFFYHNFS